MPRTPLLRRAALAVSVGTCFFASAATAAVTLTEDATSFTLSNRVVTAQISKARGSIVALSYRGTPVVAIGYWSHAPAGPGASAGVTIDPSSNEGRRAEVFVKAISGGKPQGSGPGGSAIVDIEVRYALEDDTPGLFMTGIYSHPADYPATAFGEARFLVKLNSDVFDWLTVDARRNRKMLTAEDWNRGVVMNGKEMRRLTTGLYAGEVEHKYDYANNQSEVPTWGWCSTSKNIGAWFINPTVEYLSGGPTKVELSAHRDATFGTRIDAPGLPCLLNYWRSSHYGGSFCEIAAGESWTKTVGPFLLYCNEGVSTDALWADARARAQKEAEAWPYEWVVVADYPHAAQRGAVAGRIVLDDPQAAPKEPAFSRLRVGLSAPDYVAAKGEAVSWQTDAKSYQFWVEAGLDGKFQIKNVRPGGYTLHAIADGVLGEFARTEVKVDAGGRLELGDLVWKPLRLGRQLWDIGIPNRSGIEFFKGEDYARWGWYLEYPKLFPHDVDYVIGKSDFRRDWFFEHVPRNPEPADPTGKARGPATTWTVRFDRPAATRGKAFLRVAFAGVGARRLDVTLNGEALGAITDLRANGVVHRDGIAGTWQEKTLEFDAAKMHAGENVLGLTVPAGWIATGLIYDYLRLELAEE